MKIYISKYAGDGDIIAVDVEEKDFWEDGRVMIKMPGSPYKNSFTLDRDAHLTFEGAVSAAEAGGVKKIASLEKQIAKLKKLTFSCKDG